MEPGEDPGETAQHWLASVSGSTVGPTVRLGVELAIETRLEALAGVPSFGPVPLLLDDPLAISCSMCVATVKPNGSRRWHGCSYAHLQFADHADPCAAVLGQYVFGGEAGPCGAAKDSDIQRLAHQIVRDGVPLNLRPQ